MIREPMPDGAIALDDDHCCRLHREDDDQAPWGGSVFHRTESGGWCGGLINLGSDKPWQFESVDPLTISPSVLCWCVRLHGRPNDGMTHGFVRQGRWEPCGPLPGWAVS